MASALGYARGGWRPISNFVRRLRQYQSAMVTGRVKDRIHFEPQREYFVVDPDDSRWCAERDCRSRAKVFEADGEIASPSRRPQWEAGGGAGFRYGGGRSGVCTG